MLEMMKNKFWYYNFLNKDRNNLNLKCLFWFLDTVVLFEFFLKKPKFFICDVIAQNATYIPKMLIYLN